MTGRASVLVVYQHELLGEGLTARLRGLGAEAMAVRSGDGSAVAAALRDCPKVVVVETTDRACLRRVRRLCPRSRVVDVTASMRPGCTSSSPGFDAIVDALWAEGQATAGPQATDAQTGDRYGTDRSDGDGLT